MNAYQGGTLVDELLVKEAERLTPILFEEKVEPRRVVEVVADDQAFQGWGVRDKESWNVYQEKSFGKGDSFIVDFGDHQVGYVTLSVKAVGSPPDAPLGLKLIFGEMPVEMGESFDSYDGWLSKSWLQEETIYVDVLPAELRLPRRYCFRYMKVIVLDTSRKYTVAFPHIACTAVTSADVTQPEPLPVHIPQDLQQMDRIGMKTLQDCMQTVFEDGPKRDRRLWIGDLRLQALANYYTFRSDDLVKRCLYLFGGMRLASGHVGACVFEKPQPHADDTFLYDYALFFTATLHDYYEATRDSEALKDLWPIAMEQLRLGLDRLDDRGIVKESPTWWCFIDWQPELNKQASAQAILLYCLKKGLALANAQALTEESAYIQAGIERVRAAIEETFWDEEFGMYISGPERQISWATQIWMVLAGVKETARNAEILERLFHQESAVRINTPYMYHHLIEALFESGSRDRAIEEMRKYWGEMVQDGADTFWEVYNPENKTFSPYGSNLINSYCHAWSCTPTYFIRKYLV